MGRPRLHDTDLPTCMYEHHGGYRYSYRINRQANWLFLGRDRSAAIERAEALNSMKRAARTELLAAMRSPSEELRDQVHQRDGFACVYCGTDTDLVVDHFIPFEKGGATHIDNLVTACRTCNGVKGSRHPIEFLTDLLAYRDRLFDEILGRVITHRPVSDPVTPETESRGTGK